MKNAAPAEYSVLLCARAWYSLFACMGDVWRHGVFAVHDHGERLTVVSFLEGGLTADQHEQDHPQTPDICKDTQGIMYDHTEESCAHSITTKCGFEAVV